MVKPTFLQLAPLVIAATTLPVVVFADGPVTGTHEPTYTTDGKLTPPADYREWVFLSSGLDMSYNEKANASPDPVFDNVFANPEAYRVFLQTGTWPDKTQFVLEVRGSSAKGSINHRGHFQSGEVKTVEMHVKDQAHFDGGLLRLPSRSRRGGHHLHAVLPHLAAHRQEAGNAKRDLSQLERSQATTP